MLRPLIRRAVRFLKAEDGPTAVEYAVMLSFITVVCAGAVMSLGTKSRGSFITTAGMIPVGS